jgi:hypothetical protein
MFVHKRLDERLCPRRAIDVDRFGAIRELITTLAARLRLPTIYPFRYFVPMGV